MDVVFVVPPFADLNRPGIGVSLLKAGIEREGFESRVDYCSLSLAEIIGVGLYQRIANGLPSECLLGEWFFADLVFEDLPDEAGYINKVLSRHGAEPAFTAAIIAARNQRKAYVEQCSARILKFEPRIVGFTTTFHQTCSSLAIAQRLKQSKDAPIVVFGGANCEGEMGLQMIRSFPMIDYVSTGEADLTFPQLLRRLLGGDDGPPIPGMLGREEAAGLTWPARVNGMDGLPFPDYQEYFEQLAASPVRSDVEPSLLIETSRGCWWGAKQHCTFCGLNGDSMAFRSKSPDRVFDELAFLSHTYGLNRIDCVDNILDMKYVTTLFPKLADSGMNLEMFYEVKANLRYDQLVALRDGGITSIQPGIESFSNEILRLMRKGCTGLQNIQLLRWCTELNVAVAWNILAGFPGETIPDYEEQASLIPLLAHLPPPASCTPIRLDRFSPLFARAEEFGLDRIRPSPAYYYVYPLSRRELCQLAYSFDFDYEDGRDPHEYIGEVRREVVQWWSLQHEEPDKRPRLDAIWTDHEITIEDSRPGAATNIHRLTGLAAEAYFFCDSSHSFASVCRQFRPAASETEIRSLLDEFVASKLMIEMEGHYLSLAVFRNRPRKEGSDDSVCAEYEKAPATIPLLHLV